MAIAGDLQAAELIVSQVVGEAAYFPRRIGNEPDLVDEGFSIETCHQEATAIWQPGRRPHGSGKDVEVTHVARFR